MINLFWFETSDWVPAAMKQVWGKSVRLLPKSSKITSKLKHGASNWINLWLISLLIFKF